MNPLRTTKVGITGSRDGMRGQQAKLLVQLMGMYRRCEFHHGDCVGVDKDGYDLASYMWCKTVAHPPTDPKLRAFTESDVILPPEPYMIRNQAIVDAVDVLIVVPAGPAVDNPRSGTWATFRMAMRRGITVHLLMPGGASHG